MCVSLSLASYKVFVSKTFCAFFPSNSCLKIETELTVPVPLLRLLLKLWLPFKMQIDLKAPKGCKWVLRIRVHEVECDQAACVCSVDRGRRYEKSTTPTTRKTKERRRMCNKSFVSHTTPTATPSKEACVAHDVCPNSKSNPLLFLIIY